MTDDVVFECCYAAAKDVMELAVYTKFILTQVLVKATP